MLVAKRTASTPRGESSMPHTLILTEKAESGILVTIQALPAGTIEAAAAVFQRLRRARIRIGTMDMKIAAIVVSVMRPCCRGISQTFDRSPVCKSRTRLGDGGQRRGTGQPLQRLPHHVHELVDISSIAL